MPSRGRGRPPHPDLLTPAERRVLEELRKGGTNAEIAVRIGIGPETVKTHVSNMLGKLGVEDRHQLAAWRPGREGVWPRVRGLFAAPVALATVGRSLAWVAAGLAGAIGVVVLVVVLLIVSRDGGDEAGPWPVAPEPTEATAPAATAQPTTAPEATPTPTATPEATPTPTATPEATPTPTATPEATPTPTATPEATPTPTATAEANPTATPNPLLERVTGRGEPIVVRGYTGSTFSITIPQGAVVVISPPSCLPTCWTVRVSEGRSRLVVVTVSVPETDSYLVIALERVWVGPQHNYPDGDGLADGSWELMRHVGYDWAQADHALFDAIIASVERLTDLAAGY